MPRRFLADLALLVVTAIWGLTFVMVRDAVHAYPVFAFLATRFALALVGLVPVLLWRRHHLRAVGRGPRRRQWAAGALIGVALFAGYAFQTLGLLFTTPAKAGFITGLSVVIVPLLGVVCGRERLHPAVIGGVAVALVGLGFLSLSGVRSPLAVNPGDLLVLACAVSFAGQIVLVGRFAPRMNALVLTAAQIATVALLSAGISLVWEHPPVWPPRGQPLFAALFTGLLATALAFGVQTAAQRFTTATHAALIFAAEPVFAALGSYLLIGELLSPAQWLGCGFILAGMLLAELGPGLRRRRMAAVESV
jgi:drug/metabolite transporter (DMT)-like permease